LLDPTERRKYDAELAYMRGAETFSTAPQPTPAAPSPPPPQSSQTRAAPPPKQAKKYSFWEPRNSKFAIAALTTLAVGSVLLSSGIAGSEQAVDLGLAFITTAFGLLCWRHGSRPTTDASYLGGSVFLFIFAIVLFYAGLQSTPSVTKVTAPSRTSSAVATAAPQTNPYRTPDGKPDRGKTSGRASAPAKRLERAPSGPRPDSDPVLAAINGVGENASNTNPTVNAESKAPSGSGLEYVTKTWKSLRDGQIYRTHFKADILYLTSADNYQNRIGDFTSCEFQRAVSPGLSWTGFCWVRNPKDQSTYRSPATLADFSNNRIEGSTTYIPDFIMIPLASASATPPPNANMTEASAQKLLEQPMTSPSRLVPRRQQQFDISSLTGPERQSIESACSYDKYSNGPAAYNRCLEGQLGLLRTAPRRPDLSALSNQERQSIESACSYDKYSNGPAAYNRCLEGQLGLLRTAPRRPDLSALSNQERQSIESACSYDKYSNGPAAYNRCLVNQLDALRRYFR